MNNLEIEGYNELDLLGHTYKADKSPLQFHTYTPVYYKKWNDKRDKITKVFELGINAGASLYMWQDFFPNAQVIGADFKESLLFTENRITSYYVDQREEESIKKLAKEMGANFDIMIDDGSHDTQDQIRTAKLLVPLLKKTGVYVIEDVHEIDKILAEFPDAEVYKGRVLPGDYQDDNLVFIYA